MAHLIGARTGPARFHLGLKPHRSAVGSPLAGAQGAASPGKAGEVKTLPAAIEANGVSRVYSRHGISGADSARYCESEADMQPKPAWQYISFGIDLAIFMCAKLFPDFKEWEDADPQVAEILYSQDEVLQEFEKLDPLARVQLPPF